MPSEDVTFALALIGAATGGAASIAQVYSTVRDRPRITINFGITTRANGSPTIWIDAMNDGNRATTIRELGFYAHPRTAEFIHEGETEPWGRAVMEITFTDGPFFLEAGQSKRVEIIPNIDTYGIHADYPMRVFAVDMRGQRLWGEAAPVIRMLVGNEPPLPPDTPADFRALFEPARPDLKPWKVEPGWKVWKKRELRAPDRWKRRG